MAFTETCTKCDGTGLLRWGVIDRPDHKKSCWDCEGVGHKTFKTSPEDRALARARAQKKRDEALLARQEKRLAKQREITGGLTFAEIAKILTLSNNTAASRYRYALEQLQKKLKYLKNSRHG